MKLSRYLAPATIVLAVLSGSPTDLTAQVVDARDSEANPASVLFRATLYGAGTGLALGGAYALVNDDDDPGTGTGEILRWGVAGGAAAGFLVGLVYLATRSQPEGEFGEEAMLQIEDGDLHVSPLGVLDTGKGLGGPGALDLNLVAVRF